MATVEERLAALEAEVTALREKVTDTHTLAAHADRDVAEFRDELRAQTQLINFTRLDVTELRTELVELRTEMVGKFDQVNSGLHVITRMLEGLGGEERGAR